MINISINSSSGGGAGRQQLPSRVSLAIGQASNHVHVANPSLCWGQSHADLLSCSLHKY